MEFRLLSWILQSGTLVNIPLCHFGRLRSQKEVGFTSISAAFLQVSATVQVQWEDCCLRPPWKRRTPVTAVAASFSCLRMLHLKLQKLARFTTPPSFPRLELPFCGLQLAYQVIPRRGLGSYLTSCPMRLLSKMFLIVAGVPAAECGRPFKFFEEAREGSVTLPARHLSSGAELDLRPAHALSCITPYITNE